MTKFSKVSIGLVVLLSVTVAVGFKLFEGRASLQHIHSAITASYPNVDHVSAAQFEMFDPDTTLIFDVREPEEYAVSHFPGAILLAPNADIEEFLEDFGDEFSGKKVVFYCSVGRRSSELLSRLLEDPSVGPGLHQAQAAVNLEGGIFTWVNSDRSLVNSEQKMTLKVHPFNAFWGRLIEDESKRQY